MDILDGCTDPANVADYGFIHSLGLDFGFLFRTWTPDHTKKKPVFAVFSSAKG